MTGTLKVAEGSSFTGEKIRIGWERILAALIAPLKPSPSWVSEIPEQKGPHIKDIIGGDIGSPLVDAMIQEALSKAFGFPGDVLEAKKDKLRNVLTVLGIKQVYKLEIDNRRKAALKVWGPNTKTGAIDSFAFDENLGVVGTRRNHGFEDWVCVELKPFTPVEPVPTINPGKRGEFIND